MIASNTENAYSYIFVWSETWTSYIESTGTSEYKKISKLGVETALGTNDLFNDFMRANKSDVANSPQKIISSGKKCNMFSKFWMAPLVHNFDKFSSEKTCFSFGQEVASPSLSVVSHKRNMLISVSLEWCPVCCTFLQSLKWTVSFFCVSSHFTTAVLVFLSMLIICPRWIQCFPWFFTLTQSPS